MDIEKIVLWIIDKSNELLNVIREVKNYVRRKRRTIERS